MAVVAEVHGFKYFEERDLLGFVDGTENPVGRAAQIAVTVGAEDPAFSGSSYVVVQKYLHALTAWNALSTETKNVLSAERNSRTLSWPSMSSPQTPTSR